MPKQILYILCGIPFAGKTTFAKTLAKKTKAHLLSLDQINSERGFSSNGARIVQKEWDVSYKVANRNLERMLNNSHSVIYDDTNYSFQKREALRKIARKWKVSTVTIYINTPLAVVRERIAENMLTNQRNPVHPDDFSFVCRKFEKPFVSEKYISIS